MNQIKRTVRRCKYRVRRQSLILFHRLGRNRIYTVRNGLAKGLKRKGGMGFLPEMFAGENKKKEVKFLKSLSFDGMTVFDVGGYQGVFTLFFARAVGSAGQVLTFEPNPASFASIQDNVALNRLSNVKVYNLGVGREKGKLELVYDPMFAGEGSFNDHYKERNLATGRALQASIPVASLDDCVFKNGFPAPQFIKIDVEGFEKEVLLGAMKLLAEHKPKMFIEMHGLEVHKDSFLAQTEEIITMLLKHSYSIYRVESNEKITAENFSAAREGHIYCT